MTVPFVLFVLGQTFVLSSTYALGITGTFLGDYCGILMDHRVEGFPFNILENPMYTGSTMCFIATALWYAIIRYSHLQKFNDIYCLGMKNLLVSLFHFGCIFVTS